MVSSILAGGFFRVCFQYVFRPEAPGQSDVFFKPFPGCGVILQDRPGARMIRAEYLLQYGGCRLKAAISVLFISPEQICARKIAVQIRSVRIFRSVILFQNGQCFPVPVKSLVHQGLGFLPAPLLFCLPGQFIVHETDIVTDTGIS